MKGYILVYLKNSNQVFQGKFEEDEYEAIYDSWKNKEEFITFSNGEFLVSEIAGIQWEV